MYCQVHLLLLQRSTQDTVKGLVSFRYNAVISSFNGSVRRRQITTKNGLPLSHHFHCRYIRGRQRGRRSACSPWNEICIWWLALPLFRLNLERRSATSHRNSSALHCPGRYEKSISSSITCGLLLTPRAEVLEQNLAVVTCELDLCYSRAIVSTVYHFTSYLAEQSLVARVELIIGLVLQYCKRVGPTPHALRHDCQLPHILHVKFPIIFCPASYPCRMKHCHYIYHCT